MRKIRIIEHISLDGVIQAPAGRRKTATTPTADGRCRIPTRPWERPFDAAHGEAFDLLLGRRTYDIWSDYWPKAEREP